MTSPGAGGLTPSDEQALRDIAAKLPDPSRGLPDPVFDFALAVTPMINVDLLLLDAARRFLLAWRVDPWSTGWHIPGGIVRFNEPRAKRIAEVARLELGVEVDATTMPLRITEFFGTRGHFISLLHPCTWKAGSFDRRLIGPGDTPRHEDLRWFETAPDEVYAIQGDYVRNVQGLIAEAMVPLQAEGRWPPKVG